MSSSRSVLWPTDHTLWLFVWLCSRGALLLLLCLLLPCLFGRRVRLLIILTQTVKIFMAFDDIYVCKDVFFANVSYFLVVAGTYTSRTTWRNKPKPRERCDLWVCSIFRSFFVTTPPAVLIYEERVCMYARIYLPDMPGMQFICTRSTFYSPFWQGVYTHT